MVTNVPDTVTNVSVAICAYNVTNVLIMLQMCLSVLQMFLEQVVNMLYLSIYLSIDVCVCLYFV